jgi:exosortase family protein XrtF
MKINPALRFFVLLIGIYLSIYFIHQWYILPYGKVDDFLNHQLGWASEKTLQLFGADAYLKIVPQEPIPKHFLYLQKQAVVFIGSACNGFLLYVLYTCFIMLSTGKWLHKFLFVIMGIAVIFILNVIRVIILLYLLTIDRELFDINHHFVFNFIVYGFIFLLWKYWFDKQVPQTAQ